MKIISTFGISTNPLLEKLGLCPYIHILELWEYRSKYYILIKHGGVCATIKFSDLMQVIIVIQHLKDKSFITKGLPDWSVLTTRLSINEIKKAEKSKARIRGKFLFNSGEYWDEIKKIL